MIHHVFATKSNIGDWLSARAIQTLLAPVEVREHFCDEPFVAKTLTHLRAAAPDELIVIGGGGLFMDYFAPFWDGFREIAERNPFCIWGVGYCDLKRTESRAPEKLLREIVSKSRVCIVRDELTRSYLDGCNLSECVPCPTMAVIEPPITEGRGLLYADHFTVVGADGYEKISTITREFANCTGREYWEIDNQIPDGSEQALTTTLDLYRRADLVVSSRLHGCIIALAMGRKVVAVSGDHKVESFMNAAGLGQWVCDLNEIDSLPERLRALPHQQTPWRFVSEVREDNNAIGQRIRAIIAALQKAPSKR